MQHKIIRRLIGGLALALWLVGCSPENASEGSARSEQSELPTTSPQVRLRLVSAPEAVQSVVVEALARKVDTSGFSSSFNVLSSRKVIYRSDFSKFDDVVLAIQPGTVEVNVYAFPNVISEDAVIASSFDRSQATHIGNTPPFTVGVGEEKAVTVKMLSAVNLNLETLTLSKTSGKYQLSFKTSPALTGIPAQVLYNSVNPDFLEAALQNNDSQALTLNGSVHSITLTGQKVPNFLKVEINATVGSSLYRGEATLFCPVAVCGDLPLAIYDRQIALVDNTTLSQGLATSWKTTGPSFGTVYFAPYFLDQISLVKQIFSGASLEALQLYSTGTVTYDPAKASSDAVGYVRPGSETNAPAAFFSNPQVIFTLPLAQSTQDAALYPNTADCVDQLERLGQDCSRVPRVAHVNLENNRLSLDVFLGDGAKLEIYPRSQGLNGTPVATINLSYPNPDPTGKTSARTTAIDYRTAVSDLNLNYYGLVTRDGLKGSLLDLNVKEWTDLTGIAQAGDYQKIAGQIGEIPAGQSLYYKVALEAGKSYLISMEGLKGAANVYELYLIGPDQQTLIANLPEELLGFGIEEKRWLKVTAPSSGTYYLKLFNPLKTNLLFLLGVE